MKANKQRFDNGVTEGMRAEIGEIIVLGCRQSVSTESHNYVVTIQEDGMVEGVGIGEVSEIEDIYPLIEAIEKIKNQ